MKMKGGEVSHVQNKVSASKCQAIEVFHDLHFHQFATALEKQHRWSRRDWRKSSLFGRIMEVILDAGSSLEVKSALLGGDDFAVDGWMVEGESWKWIFVCP